VCRADECEDGKCSDSSHASKQNCVEAPEPQGAKACDSPDDHCGEHERSRMRSWRLRRQLMERGRQTGSPDRAPRNYRDDHDHASRHALLNLGNHVSRSDPRRLSDRLQRSLQRQTVDISFSSPDGAPLRGV
jgi:hypothetical protein